MPETVCVTVSLSELKIIDEEIEFRTEANAMVERLLAQAERLRDWQPKVGDRVRLKAMPEGGPFLIAEIDPTQTLFTASRKVKLGWRDQFGDMYPWESRYLAELMPEE